MALAAAPASDVAADAAPAAEKCLICTSITADSMEAFLQEIAEASATGVDIIELRLDFIKDFEPMKDLERLMAACSMPYIVTYRPKWEG
jgi:3-dehydroquinate dehydratase/shikimate dehydrogenase